ncbi:MAG: hypothetical protein OJF60_000016 [Burkholderiaceae bacterium]|nr:MAG: hypothetical protein OJF60_000016 [Burkholderiaceae bacterium]
MLIAAPAGARSLENQGCGRAAPKPSNFQKPMKINHLAKLFVL